MKYENLRPGALALLLAALSLAVAVGLGLFYGLALSVLILATCALGAVIALLWASVKSLAGETPLTLDEALLYGAPSVEEEQKRAVLRALKDLEFERSVGKISEDDFHEFSARYRAEAKRLIAKVDQALAGAQELAEKLADERVRSAGLDREKASAVDAREKPSAALGDDAEDSDDTDDSEDTDETDDSDDEPRTEKSGDSSPAAGTSPSADADRCCPKCQTKNDPDAQFCKRCGTSVITPSNGVDASVRSKENVS